MLVLDSKGRDIFFLKPIDSFYFIDTDKCSNISHVRIAEFDQNQSIVLER